MISHYVRKRFWPGPYPPPITLDRGIVAFEEGFIKANKLAPQKITTQELSRNRMLIGTSAIEQEIETWFWKNGGRRDLHFHLAGDVYVLTQDQWNSFSKGVLKIFSEKLEGAKAISFDRMAELSEIVDSVE